MLCNDSCRPHHGSAISHYFAVWPAKHDLFHHLLPGHLTCGEGKKNQYRYMAEPTIHLSM